MLSIPDAVVDRLRRQHSLRTRRQAFGEGMTPAHLRRLVETGTWEVLDSGLYGPAGVPMIWRRKLCAALLCAPCGSCASHRAAAALRGLGGLTEPPVEISIPRGTTFRRPDVMVHESTDLHLACVEVVDGIPTTGLRRLAVDLGGVVSFDRYKHTVRELRHRFGITSEQLLQTYLRHKVQGRNECGALRDWLDRYFEIGGVSESGIELLVLDVLLEAVSTAPVRQLWVTTDEGRFRLDLAYPDLHLCIEVDGRQHCDPDIAAADARRTAALERAGWTVVRVRSWQLASDLQRVLRVLRRLRADSVVDR